MYRIIAILSLITTSSLALAQDNANISAPIIHISESGRHIPTTSTSFSDSVSAQNLQRDPLIYVRSDEGDYVVNKYEIAYLPKQGGDLLGPFTINGDDVNNMQSNSDIARILSRVKYGDRIFLENINAVCATCAEQKEIKIKSFALLIN